jgi:hypothetical protein
MEPAAAGAPGLAPGEDWVVVVVVVVVDDF